MYETKIFNTLYDLKKFLNDNNILPSEIMSISVCSIGVVLVYFDAEQKLYELQRKSDDVLEKIRAEIEDRCEHCTYCICDMGRKEILGIIDKYKESENKE